MMIDTIKDNMMMIVTCIFILLIGVGIGAAITDMINNIKGDDNHD